MFTYQKLDDIVVEFYIKFNKFDNNIVNLYTWLTTIALSILVVSFCILGFLLLIMISHDYFQKFGLIIIEWNHLLNLIMRYFVIVFLATVGTFIYFQRREKEYKNLYINDTEHQDKYEEDYSIDSKKTKNKYTLAEYRTSWIKNKFGYENINYVCDIFDDYVNYKNELDQAFTLKFFLSNSFVKGIFAVLATGGLGFIAAYYANKLSANPDIDLIGITLYINAFS